MSLMQWEVPPHSALNILRRAEARGLSADALLAATGLPADFAMAPPERIRVTDELALLEAAVTGLGDEMAACEIGLQFDPRRTSLLSYLLMNARTLGDGLANAHRYLRLDRRRAMLVAGAEGAGTDGAGFLLRFEAGSERLRRHALYTEHFLGLIQATVLAAVGRPVTPIELRLSHDRPAPYLARMAGRFGAEVRPGRDAPGILYAPDVAALPLADPDSALLAHLTAYAHHLMASRPDRQAGELGRKVEAEIAARLVHGAPAQQDVARSLGMSPRTLTRRLAEQGDSYRAILTALRRDLARDYLRDPTLGLAQVAHLLGYADQTSFTTAYKAWTGTTPGAARGDHRAWPDRQDL
ncbi:AraC family transcriptional regulator ligand-binding domain-containing protein [Marinibacterium sp. SX1]|uniref:helix-turn-helix transcriptional regulator n=1 Tax=Marinibacterium sp. SX1 TaxID=3388424 RepID=UPI003D18420B